MFRYGGTFTNGDQNLQDVYGGYGGGWRLGTSLDPQFYQGNRTRFSPGFSPYGRLGSDSGIGTWPWMTGLGQSPAPEPPPILGEPNPFRQRGEPLPPVAPPVFPGNPTVSTTITGYNNDAIGGEFDPLTGQFRSSGGGQRGQLGVPSGGATAGLPTQFGFQPQRPYPQPVNVGPSAGEFAPTTGGFGTLGGAPRPQRRMFF